MTTDKATPEVAPEEPDSLVKKLSYIMGQMAHIKKEGFNKAQNYAFVRESDVAEKVSILLAAKSIFLHQTVISHSMRDLYTTSSGSMMRLSEVLMEFRFIDGETGETTPAATFPGHGADTGDKGVYKAMTGAEKYFLMKTFLVSTGDDPEADEKVDKAAISSGAAQGPRVVRSNVAGAERGGKSEHVTEAQVKEMSRLTKEAGLTGVTVIPVINTTLGTNLPLDLTSAKLRETLAGLSAADGAKLMSVLASGFAADIATEPESALPVEAAGFELV